MRQRRSLGWAENILEELFDLVDVRLDLAVEGDERGVRARRQVLEVCGLPGREAADSDGWWKLIIQVVLFDCGSVSNGALVHEAEASWTRPLSLNRVSRARLSRQPSNPAHFVPDVRGRRVTQHARTKMSMC